MKKIIIIITVLISGITNAQNNFEKGMSKAFEFWEADKMNEAEHMFERIAKVEPNNWLPHYYIAQINSIKTWNEKDAALVKAQLDKAQAHLDAAMVISENNPELLVMQAQVYTNWVAFDGMTYGMKYSAKITELYTKAETLEPRNPRAVFGKAEWGMGSAKYFGKDVTPYCEQIKASLDLFESFKPKSEFHPNWGKRRALQVIENCNS